MTDIEQAAKAEAEGRHPANPHMDTLPLYTRMNREAWAACASWLAEYLLSDENVEKAASAEAAHHPRYLDPESHKDHGGLNCSCGDWSAPMSDTMTRPWPEFYQHRARAALRSVLGDEA